MHGRLTGRQVSPLTTYGDDHDSIFGRYAMVAIAALLASMGHAAASKPLTDVTVLTNSDFVNGTYRIRNTGRC
jgi:hypothetical protein